MGHPLPLALVNLAAFDRNLDLLLAEARKEKKAVRLASKSVRHRGLMERVLKKAKGEVIGLMTYSAFETAWLAEKGFDNLLLAYPPCQEAEFEALAVSAKKGALIFVMADHRENILGLAKAAQKHKTTLNILLDVDMSFRPLGALGPHLGVRRSPLRTQSDVLPLARFVFEQKGLKFSGIMGYEAQIAGLGDKNPFHEAMNPFKKSIRALSRPEVALRRKEIVQKLENEGLFCELVNGGGTGSIQSSSQDDSLTEVTIGSGLLAGHLFDYFSNVAFEPCLTFALPVTRVPKRGFVTCFGGGYVSSGAADKDKTPIPYLPEGLKLLEAEGVGEVQTPLEVPAGLSLALGDPVFFRPAKSGELAERFLHYYLLQENGKLEKTNTYRGDGVAFG